MNSFPRSSTGFFALVLVLVAIPRIPAPAVEDVTAAVAALQSRYAAVQSTSANFTQTYRAPAVEQVESGVVFLRKPGLMRWEYRHPEPKLFIADGRNTYLYTPGDRQVLIRPLKASDLQSTPLQFLLGHGDILKSFTASWEKEFKRKSEGTLLVRLIPRSPEPDYEFVVLEFDEKTFDIRRILIRELTTNTSEFVFADLATNVKLEDARFRFKIPKGVEVVHVDDKDGA